MFRLLLASLFGSLLVLVVVAIYTLEQRPDLKVWHDTELDEEYRADSGIENFSQYLELEDRLFQQLEQLIYQKIDPEDQRLSSRYSHDSLADPGRWPSNWNRSFVLPTVKPTAGVLLLHGLSDSPYSMRSIGQALQQHGAYVVGLRVPGHGQAPSGLLDIRWEDMAAAVHLAVNELRHKYPYGPLYIVGYSNGGALAVQYALDSLADSALVPVDGLVLISPEIGISKLAALAFWQEKLGHLLGLQKLAWNSIQPEYDPWKYGSFALNAGKQAYRITAAIQRQISQQAAAGTLQNMPRILAFQSVVDATVTAPALVSNLFDRLPMIAPMAGDSGAANHELVLFDINRDVEIEPLMLGNPSAWIDTMLQDPTLDYALTLISNKDDTTELASAYNKPPGSELEVACDTAMAWPADVYSLSHVSLPFPPDDPTYGSDESVKSPGIRLGTVALRGEKNVLQVSSHDMLRLRYNPFYSYLERRTLAFMNLSDGADLRCGDNE